MKRFTKAVAALAVSLGSVGLVGVSVASGATTPTIALSGAKDVIGQPPVPIVATTSVPGTVAFSAAGAPITGCTAVATTTASPYLATCAWAPTTPGTVVLSAVLTPTDTTLSPVTSANYSVAVAVPVQNVVNPTPVPLYVDTIVASGNYSTALQPIYGGCQITNEFLVGQTIVFRAYGVDANGVALTPLNVSSATVTIAGVATPLKMSFGNHGATNAIQGGSIGTAFWTAALPTGGTGYSTLGLIPYTVTFKTIAVPAVTKQAPATKWVVLKRGAKVVRVHGKVVYVAVKYMKTVVVTPAVPGVTETFTPNFNSASSATLNAVPGA